MSKTKGNYFEKYAKNFFIKQGYKVIFENFYTRLGEIDLILLKAFKSITFCEVRYRKNNNFGSPADSITTAKKHKIIKTAKIFISRYNLLDHYFSFDILCISGTMPNIKVEWIKNAFSIE